MVQKKNSDKLSEPTVASSVTLQKLQTKLNMLEIGLPMPTICDAE